MKLTAEALNHLLRQNHGATARLRPHAGKVVAIHLPPFSLHLRIDGAGEFAAAPADAVADGELSLGPGAALRLLLQPDGAAGLARLAGDSQFAGEVGKVLAGLRWDAEEDLSRVIGDIPAHELVRAGQHVAAALSRQAEAVGGMLAEYWLEEQPLLAKRRHLDAFGAAVDSLRDDAERLAKRLARLEKTS